MSKKFLISRHSYIGDCDDDGITAHEIEKILNDSNKTHRTPMSEGKWTVIEKSDGLSYRGVLRNDGCNIKKLGWRTQNE